MHYKLKRSYTNIHQFIMNHRDTFKQIQCGVNRKIKYRDYIYIVTIIVLIRHLNTSSRTRSYNIFVFMYSHPGVKKY